MEFEITKSNFLKISAMVEANCSVGYLPSLRSLAFDGSASAGLLILQPVVLGTTM
jgi:hypothetical protein